MQRNAASLLNLRNSQTLDSSAVSLRIETENSKLFTSAISISVISDKHKHEVTYAGAVN